jgi:hypothetical protein
MNYYTIKDIAHAIYGSRVEDQSTLQIDMGLGTYMRIMVVEGDSLEYGEEQDATELIVS